MRGCQMRSAVGRKDTPDLKSNVQIRFHSKKRIPGSQNVSLESSFC